MIKYKVYESTKKCFILSREPIEISKDTTLRIYFEDAPQGGTAVFEDAAGRTVYKRLSNGECSIPATFLTSEIKVGISIFSGDTTKYTCESLYAKAFGEHVIVCPNGIDTPQEIANVYSKMQDLSNENERINNRLTEVNNKLEKILEGYDFE